MKSTNMRHLNKWMWKWHFIAGVVLMPFILLLTLTGSIYLFKSIYETYTQEQMMKVSVTDHRLSYEKQLELVSIYTSIKPSEFILSNKQDEASTFEVGRWSKKRTIYINPYSGKIQGDIKTSDTLMHKIKKLHGELLLGKVGSKVVELTASWTVVLILTGLYIWWPKNGWQLKGFFIIRFRSGKRAFFRDLHVITAFYLSIFLLLTLAGGLPWTDVWGSGFKTIQKMSNSGYPINYNGKKLTSVLQNKERVSLDE
ncbi:MAG: PepSY domain-containing protein, partial [Campylobacteraceae bacterium]|nr:PepSY domain-containing protein [Campylobacteraceae bacterium]